MVLSLLSSTFSFKCRGLFVKSKFSILPLMFLVLVIVDDFDKVEFVVSAMLLDGALELKEK